jgi:hypothetical protein
MPRRSRKGPEALTQDLILDWLEAEHILAYRMNTGATLVPETDRSKRRFIAYGVKGMADILSFPDLCKFCRIHRSHRKGFCGRCELRPKVLWIEVKSATGSQTPEQRSFEEQVKAAGHGYIVVRSLEDVIAYLQEG